MNTRVKLLLGALAAAGSLGAASAGSFITDFNSGLPEGSTTLRDALITPNDGTGGGFTNSGCLQLTTNVNSQTGVFIITNDLDAGAPVVSFTARFKVMIGGGNGADGLSFNFASDLDLTGNWNFPEEGNGTGLTVEFDTFYSTDLPSDNAPAIDVKLWGAEIATTTIPLRQGTFVDALVQLNPDATLTVAYDGTYVYSNLDLSTYGFIPANGYPAPGSLFGLGARTGGLNDKHYIDDLNIVTHTNGVAYVRAYEPQGRKVQTNSAIDIVLTDNTTQVDTNTIALQLDGASVAALITQDGASNTFIHFAPPSAFAFSSAHSVSLTFADNATPAPNLNSLQYGFTVIGAAPAPDVRIYTNLFVDDFESYVGGTEPLDKNYTGANAAPNGSGNPWFGPAPPNARVVSAENGVTPHSGNQMIRGSAPSDLDENWYNLAYRLNGGNPFMGNFRLDWWFYDPLGPGNSAFRDYVALGNYSTTPTTTDYPGTGSLNTGATVYQRMSLGASTGTGFDLNVYQVRIVGATDGLANGWFNLPTPRSIGWHHARIVVGPPLADGSADVVFYIDDLVNPAFWHNSVSKRGFNVIELNTNYGATSGYYDDVTFSVVATPPNLVATPMGTNLVLNWSGPFTLQSATNAVGAYADVGAGVTSPYTNNMTRKPMQFFRLRN